MTDIDTIKSSASNSAVEARLERLTHRRQENADKASFGEMLNKRIGKADIAEGDEKAQRGKAEKPLDRRLMEACYDMESIFVSKMLKEMRKTVHKNEWLHGGFAEEIFEDMLYDEYAANISRTANLGLAKLLYREMGGK